MEDEQDDPERSGSSSRCYRPVVSLRAFVSTRFCTEVSEGGSAANRQATLNLVVKRRHTEVMKPGGQPVLNPNDSNTAAWSVNFKEGRFSFLSSIG